jgi:hydrogenase nickel incorporation protein HypA/HybF
MHELAITEDVVATVAQRIGGQRVTLVRLEIGQLTGVVADSVRFCFDLVAEGTSLEGADLEIVEPAAACRCRGCGAEFAPDGPILICPCGSADVAVLAGQDLRILSVQVA